MKRGVERRLFPRRLIKANVVFEDEFGEGLISIEAEDISLGGLFLLSNIPIKVGSYVFLSFYLPDHKTYVRATGQVVRVKLPESKKGEKGIGIRFVGLSPEAAEAIQYYVS